MTIFSPTVSNIEALLRLKQTRISANNNLFGGLRVNLWGHYIIILFVDENDKIDIGKYLFSSDDILFGIGAFLLLGANAPFSIMFLKYIPGKG